MTKDEMIVTLADALAVSSRNYRAQPKLYTAFIAGMRCAALFVDLTPEDHRDILVVAANLEEQCRQPMI